MGFSWLLPLSQLPCEELFQFIRREVCGDGLRDQSVEQRTQAPATFFAAEDLALADDEHTAARPGFDDAIAGEVGIGARDSIGVEDEFLGEPANAGEVVPDTDFAGGNSETDLVRNLFVDRRVRSRADGD